MCTGGENIHGNEYSGFINIHFAIFRLILWNRFLIKYVIKNVMDHGGFISYRFHFNC